MPVKSRTIALVALAVAVLGSGACSEPSSAERGPDGQPTTTATTATATAATTNASPPPTTSTTTAPQLSLPPEATKHTTEGARAFVRHFFEVLSVAGTRADPGPVGALSTSECRGCQAFITGLEELRKSGQRFDIASITVNLTAVKPGSTPSRTIVLMQGKEAPNKIVAADGSTIASYAGGALLFETAVTWTHTGWRMAEVTKR